jgi:hypothetical protein
MASGNRKEASGDEIQNRLKSQGFNSLADVSAQQKDRIKNAGLTGAFQGVGYDISDTEGPNDFFNAPGLLNNLDGTLTDSALADNEAWMKKLQDLKNQDSKVEISDKDRKRELASTEEGRAQIYLEGISKLCSDEWRNLNVTITQSDDKVLSYLYTIENVAKAKISDSGWKNLSNINKIAQMVTAAVALCTVGKNKIPQMGYNFKDVSTVFKSFEECKSTVLSVSDSSLSALHRVTSEEDKQNAIAAINENKYFYFDFRKLSVFDKWISKQDITLAGHDIKRDLYMLMSLGADSENVSFDTAIAQYVLDSGRSNYSLAALSNEYLHYSVEEEADFMASNGQVDLFTDVSKLFMDYGFKVCFAVMNLMSIQKNLLEEENLEKIFYEVELPLVKVMAAMEKEGFKVDKDELISFIGTLKKMKENLIEKGQIK